MWQRRNLNLQPSRSWWQMPCGCASGPPTNKTLGKKRPGMFYPVCCAGDNDFRVCLFFPLLECKWTTKADECLLRMKCDMVSPMWGIRWRHPVSWTQDRITRHLGKYSFYDFTFLMFLTINYKGFVTLLRTTVNTLNQHAHPIVGRLRFSEDIRTFKRWTCRTSECFGWQADKV